MEQMIEKAEQLLEALDELEGELEKATEPYTAQRLEKIYKKVWTEYNSILKQIED